MNAPSSHSRGFLWRAAAWAGLFGIAHACGLRDYVSVLSGTLPANSWHVFLGGVYLLTYGGIVLLVPVFLLTAIFLWVAESARRRGVEPEDNAPVSHAPTSSGSRP